MIIMRRIILALTAVTLTACGVDGAAERRPDAAGDDVAVTNARDAGTPASADPASARDPDAATSRNPAAAGRTILFVGTSLTAGYRVGEEVAYPAVIQERIDAAGLPFRVVNAGISGETSAGGLRRINWSLQQPVDVLVLELGANDGLRGLDPDAMRGNLDQIIERTRSRYPDAAVVLLGMEAPPNLGSAYTARFRGVFTELAAQHDAALLPFLLDGVAGDAALNIDDGIHPNVEGHRIIAARVWDVLEPVLRRRAAQPASSD
jgi:acyl-CoA thioesterase I